jgi:uncharacterized membrane protein
MTLQKIISYILSIVLLLSAVMHILTPEFYAPLIPEFFNELFANIFATLIEGVIGIALLLKKKDIWAV